MYASIHASIYYLIRADGWHIDVGIFAPMVASLAKDDGEIGARLGICFTFTGESPLRSENLLPISNEHL
jgi:hypothetical protein